MAKFKTFSRIADDQIIVATIYDSVLGHTSINVSRSELRGTDVLEETSADFPKYFRFDFILGMLQSGMNCRA